MKEANKARLNKILQKQYRTKDGIKTYEQIINDRIKDGYTFFVETIDDSSKRKRLIQEMNSIKNHSIIAESKELQIKGRGSNYYLPRVTRYWELFDELSTNCTKNLYLLVKGNNYFIEPIPKLVYDFYNNNN